MTHKADRTRPLSSPGSRVLLCGTGRHAPGSALPDVPAVPGTVHDLGAVLSERCGVAAGQLVTLVDPTPVRWHDVLLDAAAHATDVLLCYFVGHGLVGPGN